MQRQRARKRKATHIVSVTPSGFTWHHKPSEAEIQMRQVQKMNNKIIRAKI